MPESLIDELGTLYSRAVAEGHLAVVNDWLIARRGHTPMDPAERQVRNLAILFGHLGSRGWPPFSSQQINAGELTPATPDWTKLPEELRFVGPYAERTERYEYVFSEQFRERAGHTVEPPELAELRDVAARIRQAGCSRFNEWRKLLGVGEHIEAAMVFNLLGVLDALGLEYY